MSSSLSNPVNAMVLCAWGTRAYKRETHHNKWKWHSVFSWHKQSGCVFCKASDKSLISLSSFSFEVLYSYCFYGIYSMTIAWLFKLWHYELNTKYILQNNYKFVQSLDDATWRNIFWEVCVCTCPIFCLQARPWEVCVCTCPIFCCIRPNYIGSPLKTLRCTKTLINTQKDTSIPTELQQKNLRIIYL